MYTDTIGCSCSSGESCVHRSRLQSSSNPFLSIPSNCRVLCKFFRSGELQHLHKGRLEYLITIVAFGHFYCLISQHSAVVLSLTGTNGQASDAPYEGVRLRAWSYQCFQKRISPIGKPLLECFLHLQQCKNAAVTLTGIGRSSLVKWHLEYFLLWLLIRRSQLIASFRSLEPHSTNFAHIIYLFL